MTHLKFEVGKRDKQQKEEFIFLSLGDFTEHKIF